ncbi:MAG: hypothetical protein JXB18_06300 [Sedimentisphaerales bacterium]|nr:hypothetical protein [Sedimentisphaerales bacterium]
MANFSVEQHREHGRELKKARECLRLFALDASRSYGLNSEAFRLAMRAQEAIGLLTNAMDNLACREYPTEPDDAVFNCYYGKTGC